MPMACEEDVAAAGKHSGQHHPHDPERPVIEIEFLL